MKRVGVYAGSFDPFTIGHADIVSRALQLLDELYIVLGQNIAKQPFQSVEERMKFIEELYRDDSRIKVVAYDGIVANYAKEQGAVLVRGLRGIGDLDNEQTLAEVNRSHFGVETICLFAAPEHRSISSSLIRELAAFGEDYSEYIPLRD